MKSKLARFILLILFMSASYGLCAETKTVLPTDVAAFKEKRDLCDHFRGEPPYNEERRKFLKKNIIKLCTGTDKELAKLKEKYKNDALAIKVLSSYEEDIEPNN